MSRKLFEEAQRILKEAPVKLDPVGQEDADVNNDGKKDSTDSYLKKRRGAISAAIASSKKAKPAVMTKEETERYTLDEKAKNQILAFLGKPMQEEVVSESDLPVTKGKKEKTITVRHETSGKEKVIVDTPAARKQNAEMGFRPVKEEAEEVEEAAKWRSTSVAKQVTSPEYEDPESYDYHYDNPKSTGMKKATSDTPAKYSSLSTRPAAAVASSGPRKGMITKQHGERLKSRIKAGMRNEEAEQVDEMQVANKYALQGPQKAEIPAYKRKAQGAAPLKLADLKRKDTMSDLENLRKMEEVDTDPVSEIIEHVDAFTIELPEKISYQDYLKVAMFAEGIDSLSELDESEQADFMQFVQNAYDNDEIEIVISELTYSEMQDKIYMHQKQGSKVTGVERKTLNGKPYAAYVVTDKTGMRRRYIYHGNVRRVENLGQSTAAPGASKPNQTDPNEE